MADGILTRLLHGMADKIPQQFMVAAQSLHENDIYVESIIQQTWLQDAAHSIHPCYKVVN